MVSTRSANDPLPVRLDLVDPVERGDLLRSRILQPVGEGHLAKVHIESPEKKLIRNYDGESETYRAFFTCTKLRAT